MRIFLLASILFMISMSSYSQRGFVSGLLKEEVTDKPVRGATVSLLNAGDSSSVKTSLSDSSGRFILQGIPSGKYFLRMTAIGYRESVSLINVDDKGNELQVILIRDDKSLQGVTIISRVQPVVQNGDTTEYNASQYKVNLDASTEDMIKKMPGITVDRAGTVTAQGEQVRTVTVDGKRFFGDDPTAALRNLPAEVVDKIQVFDRLSEQAQFTGFDDGSGSKSINIVTKSNKRNGKFGKVYAGYGTDQRYNAGGNMNFFKGDRRISVAGLFNNINQQNFSVEDFLGATGSGGGRSGGGGNRGGMGGGGGNWGGLSNFLVGQQNGISATNSAGINYTDKWGIKTDVSGSYFFNQSNTRNEQESNTRYFITDTLVQFYDEEETSSSKNLNHRINFRVEHKFDSSHSLVFTPSLSFQKNNSSTLIAGERYFSKVLNLDESDIDRSSSTSGFNSNNNLLYRYSFPKRGRTLSFNVGYGANKKDGEAFLTSVNRYNRNPPRTDSIRQVTDQDVDGSNYSGSLTYTEPMGKKAQLQVSYSPSVSRNNSDQIVYQFDGLSGKYEIFDTSLSSRFENKVTTHTGGLTFRKGDAANMLTIGLNIRYTTLDNEQAFPVPFSLDRSFRNLLPNASWRRKFSASKSMNIFYRSSANVPSVTQLQDVIDNSNPLFLSSGNPELRQQINHTLSGRYSVFNFQKGASFFTNLYMQLADDYVSNAIYISSRDSVIDNGVILPRGSQLSKPVNLDGYKSARLLLTGSFPLKKLKSNLNLTGGVNWSSIPGMINNGKNKTDNYVYNAGLVIASNVSEFIDFTVSYNTSFNNAVNSVNDDLNNRYVNQSAGVQFNLLSKKGWFINNDLTGQFYSGLSEGFNQNYWLWTAGAGRKFLKNNAAEIKISCFDILGQNQSISRNVTETSIEDVRNLVLTRYFMLTFSYRLRNFGNMSVPGQREGRPGGRMPGMGGGMPGMF